MARENLTAGRIAKFTSEAGQGFLWDAVRLSLAVRATPSGKKAFIWQGRLDGRSIRMTIGDVRRVGIDQARQIAGDYDAMVARGIDPRDAVAARATQREVEQRDMERQLVTVGQAFADYIQERSASGQWGAREIRRHEKYCDAGGKPYGRGKQPGWGEVSHPGILFPLMSTTLATLSSEALLGWLRRAVARAPTEAANAYRALRAFLNWCSEDARYAFVNPSICTAKAVRQSVPKAKAKDDCLQREQLAAYFAGARAQANPVVGAFFQALLLTGARLNELLQLRWIDVDFQWSALTIGDKVEGQRTIPLTPYVASLLAALPRRNEWVFSSSGVRGRGDDEDVDPSGRIAPPRKLHNRLLATAGLPHVTFHGLRRSFGTLAEWVEAPVGIVAQIMGHKPSALAEKHYRVRPLDLLRMWHVKIEGWMVEQAGIEQPTAVSGVLWLIK